MSDSKSHDEAKKDSTKSEREEALKPKSDDVKKSPIPSISDSRPPPKPAKEVPQVDIDRIEKELPKVDKPPIPSISDSRPPPKPAKEVPQVDIDRIEKDFPNVDANIVQRPSIDNTRPTPRPGRKSDIGGIFKIDK